MSVALISCLVYCQGARNETVMFMVVVTVFSFAVCVSQLLIPVAK